MCFVQETDTVDVKQLKLLKGRFNPKTLVPRARPTPSCICTVLTGDLETESV
jgi:hypothetical protein